MIFPQLLTSVSNFPRKKKLWYSLDEARLAMGSTKIGGVVDDEIGVR